MTQCPEQQWSLRGAATSQTGQGEGLGHLSLSLRGEWAHQSTSPKEGCKTWAPKLTQG